MGHLKIKAMNITTLGPGDYDSFATAILSQNHREINITESISVSRKVIIEGFSQWCHQQYGHQFYSWGKIVILLLWGGQFHYKFDIVIPETPLYKGMAV